VAEEQPEAGRVGGGGPDQRADAGVGVAAEADLLGQALADPVEDRPVQVGLGVEVAVEDGPADTGGGGDVIEAGGREACVSERLGGRGEDLVAPGSPGEPPRRGGCPGRAGGGHGVTSTTDPC
jgi:hypothetical protein